jgi:hypothetical protein
MLSIIQKLFKAKRNTCPGCKKEMRKENLGEKCCNDCKRWWGRIRVYE